MLKPFPVRSSKPLYNYNSSRCGRNLTRLIMFSEPDYDQAQRMISVMETLSPEPRLFKNSVHKSNEQYIFKTNKNIVGNDTTA